MAITNVSVTLNGTYFTLNQSFLQVFSTSGGGLTISGSPTSQTVSVPLTSNVVYSATIQVTDANGLTASSNLSFDTIAPAYTFEAEDFDYNGGQFIDNPQTNAYAGLSGVSGVDYNNTVQGGLHDYRPQGLETEALNNNDKPRMAHGGLPDYDVGYNNANSGNWGNYTRNYPAGSYYIYVRASNGDGPAVNNDSANLSVVGGAASFSGTGPYRFLAPQGSWTVYGWVPVVDSGNSNNLAVINFDGLTNTLRVTTDNGNYNANFYMLVPTNANALTVGSAIVTSAFPDGSQQFQQADQFNFAVNATAGINPGGVVVQLTGVNLSGQTSSTVLTVGNGLTITGASPDLNGSFLLNTDTAYTAFIQMTDLNGNQSSTNITFDTVNPAYYTFEAEDFNYGGGQWFPDPQTNAYYAQDGSAGIDYNNPNQTGSTYGRAGLNTEQAFDVPRVQYIDTLNYYGIASEDYDVGSTAGGQWGNYTRSFPSGVFNIFVRASNGGSSTASDAGNFSLVTSDPTQPNQTTLPIGKFSVPATSAWQKYTWVPVLNSGGGMARFTGGSVQTLRMTVDNGGMNMNYFMLVPANLSVNNPPFVTQITPDGTAMFQYTNKLTFIVDSDAGIATNNIIVNLNGRVATGLAFSGSPSSWLVTCPIQTNMAYTALITLTDSTGTVVSTNYFDTFDPNASQTFEAEDYDYNGGQFVADYTPGCYAGLGGVLDVDDYWDYNVGTSYRTIAGSGEGLATESSSGDIIRPGYSGADYDVGHNDGGNWANYTRIYPAGTYNVWIRYAMPFGNNNGNNVVVTTPDAAKISLVTRGWGTTSQTTAQLGTFTTRSTGGWQTYTGGWAPLINADGSYVQFVSDGSTNTLRYTVDSGGFNVDFFALVPANTNVPTISNIYPNGTNFFQYSTNLTFTIADPLGIDTNNVVVTVDGVVVSGLIFTGSDTSWTVTYPGLTANANHTVTIQITDSNGNTASSSFSFNNFDASDYQWEAEDYDYTTNGVSGLFFDNPQVDDYFGLAGSNMVDFVVGDPNAFSRGYVYRATNGFPDVKAGDGARSQFTAGKTDYSIGSFGGGSWANYTRNYPVGTYLVYGRFAYGASGTEHVTLSQLTSGYGTSNQTASLVGTFAVPASGGWGTWEFVQLTDSAGNPARLVLDGTQTTLQTAGLDGEVNINFFMLAPTTPAPKIVATVNGGQINLSFAIQSNYNYEVEYKNNLTDPTWTQLPGTTLISGSGSTNVLDTVDNGNRFYRVEVQAINP